MEKIKYRQHDWKNQSKVCELHELEHVLRSHIENAVDIKGILRLEPSKIANILIGVREDFHLNMETDFEESKERGREIGSLKKVLDAAFNLSKCWHQEGRVDGPIKELDKAIAAHHKDFPENTK